MMDLFLRLSYWAKKHRPTAIALLVLCKVIVGAIGFHLGMGMAINGYALPAYLTPWLLGPVAIFLLWVYPSKRRRCSVDKAVFYRRQKTADTALGLFGFAFWLYIGNAAPRWITSSTTADVPIASRTIALAMTERADAAKGEATFSLEQKERQKENCSKGLLKKWLAKRAAKSIERTAALLRVLDDTPIGLKILFTVLVVALFLGGMFGVVGLSCHLACSGMEGLAYVVFFGGLLGFGALSTWLIIKIWRRST
jgi:hypothetical protein